MEKIVFTLPTDQAKTVVDYLRSKGLSNNDISVIGHESTPLEDLPDEGEFADDVFPAAVRGAGFGGATGLLLGLSAGLVGPGLIIGGAALALITTGGATFGVLASALIGSSVPNSQIREYEESLERGEVLLFVELKAEHGAAIKGSLLENFDDLNAEGRVQILPPVA